MSLYRLFTVIFTRTDAYRDRYLSLGLTPERVQVVGEMKYDQWIDPAHPPMGQALRDRWEGAQRVLMIASSVRAEEPALLALAVRRLAADPGLRLVWVPRSPQRFDAVAAALSAAGISVVLRSALGAEMKGEMPNVQVLVGDSTGEMNVFYSIADLVFVGASLVDLGGHNIMEPMALGRPVVMGPSTYGIAFAAEPAAAAGALETLPDAASLETRIAALLDNPGQLRNMSTAAATFAAAQSGAAARTLAGLTSVLGKDLP